MCLGRARRTASAFRFSPLHSPERWSTTHCLNEFGQVEFAGPKRRLEPSSRRGCRWVSISRYSSGRSLAIGHTSTEPIRRRSSERDAGKPSGILELHCTQYARGVDYCYEFPATEPKLQRCTKNHATVIMQIWDVDFSQIVGTGPTFASECYSPGAAFPDNWY